MKTRELITAVVAALLGLGSVGAAVPPAHGTAAGPVTVVFVNPQHFTDAGYTEWGGTSTYLLDQLRTFMEQTGARYLPEGMHLEINVTDVDLAGAFEPWHGPGYDDIRVVRAIYPPKIDLNFRLTNAKGAVVKEGKCHLTDLAFQMRIAFPSTDYLRYEKSLLSDWFDSEFRDLKRG